MSGSVERPKTYAYVLGVVFLMIACAFGADEVVMSENGEGEDYPDFDSMSDTELGLYMYKAAGRHPGVEPDGNYPSLEKLSQRYASMIYGKVTRLKTDRNKIIECIKKKEVKPIYHEVIIEAYRSYSPEPIDILVARTSFPSYQVRYLSELPKYYEGNKYIVLFGEEEKNNRGDLYRPMDFHPETANGLVYNVLELKDPDDSYVFYGTMPVDDAWEYLVNCYELKAGRGKPITSEIVSGYLTSADINMLICGLILLERLDNAPEFAEMALDRIVKDIEKGMELQACYRYGQVICAVLPVLTKHLAEESVDLLLYLHSINALGIFHGRRETGRIDEGILSLILKAGGSDRSKRLERFVESIYEHQSGHEADSALSSLKWGLEKRGPEVLPLFESLIESLAP